ncbi:hypothetical protein [Streptomyces sp. NPDC017991]|uniref:hypothetical protein n=1 Tax=Streptomyces sp. NPDC017991 TaxID=3365026 RepID=UPI003797B4A1
MSPRRSCSTVCERNWPHEARHPHGGLHDRPLRKALEVIKPLGLNGAEIDAGGFLAAPHLPVEELLSGKPAPEDYLKVFEDTGVELTGLDVNDDPFEPNPVAGPKHAADLWRAIELAEPLGVDRIVTAADTRRRRRASSNRPALLVPVVALPEDHHRSA